jgi:glucose/arabinose dehydrogenase
MHRSLPAAVLAYVLLTACAPPVTLPSTATPMPATSTAAPPSPDATVLPTQQPTLAPPVSDAFAFPDAARYAWSSVASGFESPVDIQFPPDGSGRMFIVEQPGRIRIFAADAVATGPFLDITDRVDSRGNEQGLLGLAFHPQFAANGTFFVNYTDLAHHNVIARFQLSPDPRFADPASERILLSVDDPFGNHNGGVLAFGPDGYLYAGMGDGGSANDPLGNGQNLDSLLGKVLRIDVDRADPYGVPADNPFAPGGGWGEIWAYGLRNPWRMSFDRLTGDLYIADVGQGQWEEVDVIPAGSPGGFNFGWKYREGAHAFAGGPPPGVELIDPIAEYSHAEGGCSITGGYVYRGALPEWNGVYLYADYCTGKLWGLLPAAGGPFLAARPSQLLFETRLNITTFGQDPDGEVYFADRAGGIYRLQPLR